MATLSQMSILVLKPKTDVAPQRAPKLCKAYYHVYIRCTYLDWVPNIVQDVVDLIKIFLLGSKQIYLVTWVRVESSPAVTTVWYITA